MSEESPKPTKGVSSFLESVEISTVTEPATKSIMTIKKESSSSSIKKVSSSSSITKVSSSSSISSSSHQKQVREEKVVSSTGNLTTAGATDGPEGQEEKVQRKVSEHIWFAPPEGGKRFASNEWSGEHASENLVSSSSSFEPAEKLKSENLEVSTPTKKTSLTTEDQQESRQRKVSEHILYAPPEGGKRFESDAWSGEHAVHAAQEPSGAGRPAKEFLVTSSGDKSDVTTVDSTNLVSRIDSREPKEASGPHYPGSFLPEAQNPQEPEGSPIQESKIVQMKQEVSNDGGVQTSRTESYQKRTTNYETREVSSSTEQAADSAAEKIRTYIPSCGLEQDARNQLSKLVSEMQQYAHGGTDSTERQVELSYTRHKTSKTTVTSSSEDTSGKDVISSEAQPQPQPQKEPFEQPPSPKVATEFLTNLSSLLENVTKPNSGQQGQDNVTSTVTSSRSFHSQQQVISQQGDQPASIQTKAEGYLPVINGVYKNEIVNAGVVQQQQKLSTSITDSQQIALDRGLKQNDQLTQQQQSSSFTSSQVKKTSSEKSIKESYDQQPEIVQQSYKTTQTSSSTLDEDTLKNLHNQLAQMGIPPDHPINRLLQQSCLANSTSTSTQGGNVNVQYSSSKTSKTRTVTYEGQGQGSTPENVQSLFGESLTSLENVGQQQKQGEKQQQNSSSSTQFFQTQTTQSSSSSSEQQKQLQQDSSSTVKEKESNFPNQQQFQVNQKAVSESSQQQQKEFGDPSIEMKKSGSSPADTNQQRESVEEGFVDEHGNVVVSKKITRIVTTTKTTYDSSGGEPKVETSRSVHESSSTGGPGKDFQE